MKTFKELKHGDMVMYKHKTSCHYQIATVKEIQEKKVIAGNMELDRVNSCVMRLQNHVKVWSDTKIIDNLINCHKVSIETLEIIKRFVK